MVDAAVEDTDARNFWKDNFIEKPGQEEIKSAPKLDFVTLRTSVPWQIFIQKFAPILNLPQQILKDQLPTFVSEGIISQPSFFCLFLIFFF